MKIDILYGYSGGEKLYTLYTCYCRDWKSSFFGLKVYIVYLCILVYCFRREAAKTVSKVYILYFVILVNCFSSKGQFFGVKVYNFERIFFCARSIDKFFRTRYNSIPLYCFRRKIDENRAESIHFKLTYTSILVLSQNVRNRVNNFTHSRSVLGAL